MKQVAKWSVLVYTECFEGLLGLSMSIVSDMQYNESNLHLHGQQFFRFFCSTAVRVCFLHCNLSEVFQKDHPIWLGCVRNPLLPEKRSNLFEYRATFTTVNTRLVVGTRPQKVSILRNGFLRRNSLFSNCLISFPGFEIRNVLLPIRNKCPLQCYHLCSTQRRIFEN